MPEQEGSARPGSNHGVRGALYAFAGYLLLAIAATWPLALGLGRDVPWDLGDSVLSMWILSWDAEQFRLLLGGDVSRVSRFFDGNIFHPLPLTLAYSEHHIPQALQILPVYLVTENPILCYNLLFLSTFALSGLGMYLFVRQLTGNGTAAFIAGVLFAFAPYRIAQSSHLHVISSQWMPFTFYGLLRYFDTRRLRPLAGAAAALVLQNLSSGYYLLFFGPFAVAYGLWELVRRGLWRERRVCVQLAAALLLVAAVTAVFLIPYVALRNQGFAFRTVAEISGYSADVYSYATAYSQQRVWGSTLQMFPKPEGELFPGLVPLFLALVGVLMWGEPCRARLAGLTRPAPQKHPMPRWLIWLLAATAIGYACAAIATIVSRRIAVDTGLFVLRMSNVDQLLLRAVIALILLLVVSPAVRMRVTAFLGARGFYVLGVIVAVWLSLGPAPQSLGRPLEISALYRFLYDYVPGFEGVRVPARFAMIAAFLLAILAGFGADALARRRASRVGLVVLAGLFLLEATHLPFPINRAIQPRGYNPPEARLYRPGRAPRLYHEVARQPEDAVLVELPLGYFDFDLRAMFYSTIHWRPIVNGYSGFFPPHYERLAAVLSDIPRHPDLSLETLRAIGVTHAIVHEGAYLLGEGVATTAAFTHAGAVELFRDGDDVLILLPR
jgi:hypothetical protein